MRRDAGHHNRRATPSGNFDRLPEGSFLPFPWVYQSTKFSKRGSSLRTRPGRLIRDIRRKIDGGRRLREIFAIPLSRAA